jgi:hypothetical protein
MSADQPSTFLRRAGTGALADGSVVTWSVAEGARGRRWRWTLASGSGLRHAGLVELDAEGLFVRLELEAGEGMLTLHPDPDRQSVHGNVVRAGGVDPVELPWSNDDRIGIDGDPFGSAVARWRGRGWLVGTDLSIQRADDERNAALELDGRGIPLVGSAREWALEA